VTSRALIYAELVPHPCCSEPAKAVFDSPDLQQGQESLIDLVKGAENATESWQLRSGGLELLGHPSVPAAAAQYAANRCMQLMCFCNSAEHAWDDTAVLE
jgi:hypothetical protein